MVKTFYCKKNSVGACYVSLWLAQHRLPSIANITINIVYTVEAVGGRLQAEASLSVRLQFVDVCSSHDNAIRRSLD